jgi:IS30 family transposase
LRAVVEAKLALRWSPEQIAGWLPLAYPQEPVMRVSHETIYLSLFVQGRGALRRELQRCLRTGRAMRYPRGKRLPQGRGQLRDTLHISQRPAEAADRAVPGHWEGDLVFGRRPSAVGTLVERRSRYVLLFPLPEGVTAHQVRPALTAAVLRLPQQLRRSLTWDHGREMAEHLQFTVDSGVQVYFCDPRSPWQRGTNENTNGLLRQYLPKSADLRQFDQAALDAIAAELNARPRQPSAFRHPHRSWRRRCVDPLRPPPYLQQPKQALPSAAPPASRTRFRNQRRTTRRASGFCNTSSTNRPLGHAASAPPTRAGRWMGQPATLPCPATTRPRDAPAASSPARRQP